MSNVSVPFGFCDFYHLLLMIRSRLPVQAKIDTEKVLQMRKTHSKIILKMHYTLIEDIAIKGEVNEGNHKVR